MRESLDLIAAGRTDWISQDPSKGSFFHKRSVEESRIDWTWPAQDIVNLVRAQSDPYPNAYTFHRGDRVRVLEASVSERNYGGTPGRIILRQGSGMVIVAGADARRGRSPGLVIRRLRTDDDREDTGRDYFPTTGGYLTSRP